MTPPVALDLEELRRLAEAVMSPLTNWVVAEDEDGYWSVNATGDGITTPVHYHSSFGPREADARFRAALSPSVTLALLDRIEELERDLVLALAHDRQPYPTAAAYEAVCATNEDKRRRIEELETAAEAVSAALTEHNIDFSGLSGEYPAVYYVGRSIQALRAALAASTPKSEDRDRE